MKTYASRADYEMEWHMHCDYCLETVSEGETYLSGEDENHEWHTCCLHCGEGEWYVLEDSHGNTLIERDGTLHHFDPDHYWSFVYGDYEDAD